MSIVITINDKYKLWENDDFNKNSYLFYLKIFS